MKSWVGVGRVRGGVSLMTHGAGPFLQDPTSQHLESSQLQLSFLRRLVPASVWGVNLAFGLRGGGNGRPQARLSVSYFTTGALNPKPPWLSP